MQPIIPEYRGSSAFHVSLNITWYIGNKEKVSSKKILNENK